MNRIELLGQKFGRLTVVSFAGSRGGRGYWKCTCECGGEATVRAHYLRSSHTRSCGCLQREKNILRLLTHGESRGRWTKEYRAFNGMKARCLNPKCKKYALYGGRGITISEGWLHSYPAFLSYIGRAPSPKHSIDRIDPNGNYEPGNVRWATSSEQRRNQRRCSQKAA